MHEPDTISIVIPTHNRAKDLQKAINSVSTQTILPDELIVVDDGSSKPITQEIFDTANADLKIKLLTNSKPKGANHARNRGIKEASGEWIAFLDDDDEFLPNKIEEIHKVLAKHGDEVDLIYHRAIVQMVNEKVSYITKPRQFHDNEDIFNALLIKNYIGGTPMVVARRSKLMESGLFDENLGSLQDYELWIRLAKHGARFRFLNSTLTKCYYITQNKSISKSLRKNIVSLSFIENKYSRYYKKLNPVEIKQHNSWQYDMQVHKAYLNKKYLKSIYFNIKALIKFRRFKYLLGIVASLFGAKVVFKLRAMKG